MDSLVRAEDFFRKTPAWKLPPALDFAQQHDHSRRCGPARHGEMLSAGAGDVRVDGRAGSMRPRDRCSRVTRSGSTVPSSHMIEELDTLDAVHCNDAVSGDAAGLGRTLPQNRRARECRHSARDAVQAKAFGAEGIGLCRTERMFFAADRIPHMRAMILADNEKDRRTALKEVAAHAAREPLLVCSKPWTGCR